MLSQNNMVSNPGDIYFWHIFLGMAWAYGEEFLWMLMKLEKNDAILEMQHLLYEI